MEKVRPWCGQPSDRGRLNNRKEQIAKIYYSQGPLQPNPNTNPNLCYDRLWL